MQTKHPTGIDGISDEKLELLAYLLEEEEDIELPVAQTISPNETPDPAPLSFAQQRLWFLHQWEPFNPAYNVPLALHLTGRLDVVALCRAFSHILHRHRVLQMIYGTVGEEAVQMPHPEPRLAWHVVDLTALPTGERETEAARLSAAEAARPFDLARDLLVRTTLLRLNEAHPGQNRGEAHLLLLTIHHIATDGWSTAVLIEELVALYAAYCKGTPSPLPELPIQYADFAHWQRRWLQGPVLDEQLAYWKQQLAGAPAVLELPTDRPRPPVRTFNGACYHFSLSPALVQNVRSFSQREGLTPFMTTLAALQILLGRYSGQDDVVVGSLIAGRNRSEVEGLIGFFVNTLVLRTDLSGNPRVRELLQRVREVTLEAYVHQDLPFEKLIQELQPERSLSHNAFFQVMFNYQNAPRPVLELPDLTLEYSERHNGTAKIDLTLALKETEDGISATLTYNTDLFDADTIQRIAERFQMILSGMAADPKRRLVELPLLTPAERQQLLVEWAGPQTAYPPVQCLHQLFEQQVARTPDGVAVACENRQYTYRELNQRANQVAHYLQSLGVGPDVRVGLLMERSLDVLVALIGILKAGGAYVPLDPIYPPQRVRFMLQDVQVSVLVTQAPLATPLPDLGDVRVVCLDQDWEKIGQHPVENPSLNVIPSNLIYVLFTSGSTGRPKGVAVEHRNYLNYYHGVMPRLKVSPGMNFALVSTFSTDLGTIQFWAPLTTGGTVHVFPYERATDPEAMVNYFSRHRIDVLKLVPSHFDALQSAPGADALVPRHLVIFTGEPSPWQTVAQVKAANPHCMVQDHYGVTETTCATLTYVVPDEVPAQHGATLPLGRPLGNVRVHVLDPNMEPTPIGMLGELYIGGLGVTRGYVGRPDLSAGRFVPDPFALQGGAGARLYRTGDLAMYRPDGSLKLLGRMDYQVKIRGYRVEIGEIEALLCQHPGVQDAVVVAREEAHGDRRLVAYVVPYSEQDGDFSVLSLREGLRAQLPDYMLPSAFVRLERIPLNPNGKVDRFALPAPAYTRLDSEAALVAPRNALEVQIANAWSEVLGVQEIGIDDNFFDLGGESFKAIRAVRKIGDAVSVMDLFKHPTIRELAELVSQGQPQSDSLLHALTPPAPDGDTSFTLVCIPYGGGNAVMYQPLAKALSENCALYAVQIPGHDYGRRDELLQPLPEIARRCAEQIKQQVNGPLALYGHCVGGALAVEIVRLLEAEGVEVVGLFLGGTFPSPRLPGRFFDWLARVFPSDRWTSSRAIFEGLRALGGFNDVIDPQERAFVMQSLRHDVRQAEDYYTQAYATREGEKLRAPLVCVIGQRDRATELYEERYKEWEFFGASVEMAVIPQAGHYFLKHQAVDLARIITRHLAVWQASAPETPHLASTGRRREKQERPVGPATAPQQRPSLAIFFLVALGQFVSLIGTSLTAFALGVWVYQKTGSVSDFATISVFALLPALLLLPLAGAVVDHWERRKIMILSDVAAAGGTLLVLALFRTGSLQMWHIYVVASIGALANAFQQPAYTAAIAQLVPKQYLGHANGIAQLGTASGNLLAPLLGGALVVMIGPDGVVLIDLATFVFAIVTLLLIRFPDTLFRKREEPMLQEVVKGWRYIIKRHGLVAMVVFFVVINFLFSVAAVLVTPLVLSFGSPAVLGTVMAADGAGMLVGSLVMSVWGGTKRRAEGMVGFVTLFGLCAVVMGLRPAPLYPTIGLFGIGVSVALVNAHWLALIQTKVGLELQGRVLSTNQMLAGSMMPLGFVLAGFGADKVFEPFMSRGGVFAESMSRLIGAGPGRGMGLMVILTGVMATIWAILGYRYRPLRYMEDELPDAIPDAVIASDKDELQRQADRQLLADAV